MEPGDRSLVIMSLYGFLAAVTYDCVAKTIWGHPLLALPIFVSLSLAIILPFSSKAAIKSELKNEHFLRPFLFSIGQLLVVGSLSYGSPFASFVSAAAGTTIASIFGKLFLRERISLQSLLGIGITITSVVLMKATMNLPYLGLLAGLVQGTGVFFARRRSLTGARPVDMAAASLLLLLTISIPIVIAIWHQFPTGTAVSWLHVAGAGIGFAALQGSYCYLSSKVSAWMLSLVGNTRIPASVLISALLSTQVFSWNKMLLSISVFAGVFLSYTGMKHSNKTTVV